MWRAMLATERLLLFMFPDPILSYLELCAGGL